MTKKLTNRQAIGVLDGLWSNPLFGEAHRQAFEIGIKAIKALEQEPILDKIRAEIEQLRNSRAENYNIEQYCDHFDARIIFRDDVLEIIDKYRAERSE